MALSVCFKAGHCVEDKVGHGMSPEFLPSGCPMMVQSGFMERTGLVYDGRCVSNKIGRFVKYGIGEFGPICKRCDQNRIRRYCFGGLILDLLGS